MVQLSRGRYGDAARLIIRVGLRQNLRSLDAPQLAAALHLRLTHPGLAFVSGDQPLLGVAAGEGLAVVHV